ncbi:MAG: uridine kinase [Methanobacteriota archaeon]|nr:MAG: uridine kinase [Euryarchaeota archaeon]|tara:strand:- start:22577 stop:23194 length:618 start_codon:yes stop_codon:yes gene_type:complete
MREIECKIIAIAGGSGAGKTTLANEISSFFKKNECKIISQDNYYIDLSDRFDFDGGSINFDHPDMLELNLLAKHLKLLKQNKEVNIPTYDFKTHSRLEKTEIVKPSKIILVDGTLLLNSYELNSIFDLRIFIKVSDKMRLKRRIKRDKVERGRKLIGIMNQWKKQVLPMHNRFVKSTETSADLVINENENLYKSAIKICDIISNL